MAISEHFYMLQRWSVSDDEGRLWREETERRKNDKIDVQRTAGMNTRQRSYEHDYMLHIVAVASSDEGRLRKATRVEGRRDDNMKAQRMASTKPFTGQLRAHSYVTKDSRKQTTKAELL